MKIKKVFSVIISLVILLSSAGVSASVLPPQESAVWTNLTDSQADDLLNSKSNSFIFFFYRDTCPNSQRSISSIIKYASSNGISLCGLNVTEYPGWTTWSKFLTNGQMSIGFPFVVVYNAKENLLASKDSILSVKDFEELLKKVNMQPGSGNNSGTIIKSAFKDVKSDSPYMDAINNLASAGVLSGYEDGTFRPDNNVSRTEAAVVIVRAGEISIHNTKKSTFSDVSDAFWGKDYIMAASEAGILNGMGGGIFAPQNNVTRVQMIKMLVCMLGLEKTATQNGGWPTGYVMTAKINKIISDDTYNKLNDANYANGAATRGEVAQWTYNARNIKTAGEFKVAGKVYRLGMPATELGVADEVMTSVNGFEWLVYGTDTYKNFFVAGVADGKVIALASSGVGFEYKGYRVGQKLNAQENADEFLLDKNDNNIIHGVFLIDVQYRNVRSYNLDGLASESKINFHFTNGFRMYHKMNAFKWDRDAAESARLHSTDMAKNGYFDHTGLNGSTPGQRMRDQGINWTSCAENIQAGIYFGIDAYNGWVNSSGHRANMLGTNTYLGVGFAYNANDSYKFYSTQNFYSYDNPFSTFFN